MHGVEVHREARTFAHRLALSIRRHGHKMRGATNIDDVSRDHVHASLEKAMMNAPGRNGDHQQTQADAEGRRKPMSSEVRMLSASGILGYGYPEASLKAGLERKPHMIGVDGGSSDPGPYYLGSGKSFTSTLAIRRDMRLLLNAAIANGIPMVIGTCGGAGGEPHLQRCVEIVREIARDNLEPGHLMRQR